MRVDDMHCMTEDEVRVWIDDAWKRLKPGSIFSCLTGVVRLGSLEPKIFIAVEKSSDEECWVFCLDDFNRRAILGGRPLVRIKLSRSDVSSMNMLQE